MKFNKSIKHFASTALLSLGATTSIFAQNANSNDLDLGSIVPHIYSENNSDICIGELAKVKSDAVFADATYQWYCNGVAVNGATQKDFAFETDLTPKTYEVYQEITHEGEKFHSNKITIHSSKCCNSDIGYPAAPYRLVFKEDFGEIDLSDTTGKTYKVWDYSDISNPKQITKTSTTPFRHELEEAPLGTKFSSEGPVGYKQYTVAGVLTGYNKKYKGMDGAQLQWSNDLHGIMNSEYSYDHSGKAEGCCLFVNCLTAPKGSIIYEREITNLGVGVDIHVECYISICTSSEIGYYIPQDIKLKVYEKINPEKGFEITKSQTIPENGGTGDWIKLDSTFTLESNAIKIEVINDFQNEFYGGSVVIDDILVYACGTPSLQAYFDNNSMSVEETTCDNSALSISVKPTKLLLDYYNENNILYLYQWSVTPDINSSWKNIGTPTTAQTISAEDVPFDSFETGDKVYFRAIAGYKDLFSNTKDQIFSADPFSNYSVSEPIVCTVMCPQCTAPKDDISILADKEMTRNNGVKTVALCFGDSVKLSQATDITPSENEWGSLEFEGFAIKWFESESTVNMSGSELVLNGTISDKVVTFDDPALAGTLMPITLHAVDAIYPYEICKTSDTVYIKFNPIVDAEFSTSKIEFNEGNGKGKVDLTLTNGTSEDYLINWWLGENKLDASFDIEFFENLKSENSGVYTYRLTNKETGCVGDVHNIEFAISPATGVNTITTDDEIINVYTISGALVKENVKKSWALKGLANGTYLVGNEKVVINKR
ncbi:MAG: hypothetical protein MJZ00_03520 [Paludibacteraceae bacterium]|nr:hypothetical protein [Paludibacteraceae bacterium]